MTCGAEFLLSQLHFGPANRAMASAPSAASFGKKGGGKMDAIDFFAAIEAGDEKEVAKALSSGVSPDLRTNPLCATWNKEPVKEGPTALMMAMRFGQDGVAKQLLASRADPFLTDQFKKTAAMYALEFAQSKMEALTIIIERMTVRDFMHTDMWGHNSIMYAALSGAPAVVDKLLEGDLEGQAVRSTVDDGEHPVLDLLTLSAKHGQGEVIGKLLASHRRHVMLQDSRSNAKAGARRSVISQVDGADVSKVKKLPKGQRSVNDRNVSVSVNIVSFGFDNFSEMGD